MDLEIRVLKTEDESKGKYNQLTVTYLDINSGQEHSYKLMSFVNKEAYNLLKAAKNGSEFHVVCNKNDKGYWTWETVSVLGSQVKTTKANTSPRSTYETPEERAKKQLYIVRQSSLTNAIAMLQAASDRKTPINVDTVIHVAKKFEDYVFGMNADDDFVVNLETTEE